MPISRLTRIVSRFGGRLDRRAAAGALGAGLLAAVVTPAGARQSTAESEACARDVTCQIHGVVGGGIIKVLSGDANLLLFASHYAKSMSTPAFSKFSWRDPHWEGGLDLVNSGPIYYPHGTPDSFERELKGLVTVNGSGEQPFTLRVWSETQTPASFDSCRIAVGDAVAGVTGSGMTYEAEGPLVGGELLVIHTDQMELP